MKVVIVGFALPSDRFEEVADTDRGLLVQTQKFGTALALSMAETANEVVQISVAPASDYPVNSRLFFVSREMSVDVSRIHWLELGFVNLLGVKHVTRYLAVSRALAATSVGVNDVVMVHGLNSALLSAAINVGRRVPGVRVISVMTDLPQPANHSKNWAVRGLRAIDSKLLRSALKKVDGVVALTTQLAERMAPDKAALVLDGIQVPLPKMILTPQAPPRAVYAGGLEPGYGIEMLLSAVNLSSDDWELHVYGSGSLADLVQDAAVRSPRVFFHGLLGQQAIFKAYATATVLLSPRDPRGEVVSLGFPSKILEYLSTGVPVISTMMPGLSEEYANFLTFVDYDSASLARAIEEISKVSEADRASLGRRGREFVTAHRSPSGQGGRIHSFVRDL